MTEAEIAWAAGLFEGEGSIFLSTSKQGRKYLQCRLSITDKDVIERFANIMGCGKVYGPYAQGGNKVRWDWCVKSMAEAERAAFLLKPYLGERRSAKLAWCRATVENQRSKRKPPGPRPRVSIVSDDQMAL